MRDLILVLNAGSSSLKFSVFEPTGEVGSDPVEQARGQVETIDTAPRLEVAIHKVGDIASDLEASASGNRAMALRAVLKVLSDHFPDARFPVVGHRIVHGGPDREGGAVLDQTTLDELERYTPLAPLHQTHNLAGVALASEVFPDAIQIGCFDTSYHRGHPWVNDVFAIPREYYEKGVRRYGFHGLSYDYVAGRLKEVAPLLHEGRVIVAHLGNGASMCGLVQGRSVASTMGFSALDGLPMGTRCGQLDPGVVLYLLRQEGLSVDELAEMLYRKSGLLGLSGLSHDMRTLEASDAREAVEALEYYVFRARRELGGLAAALGGLDAVVFTGGVGENSASMRQRICDGMAWIGIDLDREANEGSELLISGSFSRIRVLVIPTNEELVVARAALECLTG